MIVDPLSPIQDYLAALREAADEAQSPDQPIFHMELGVDVTTRMDLDYNPVEDLMEVGTQDTRTYLVMYDEAGSWTYYTALDDYNTLDDATTEGSLDTNEQELEWYKQCDLESVDLEEWEWSVEEARARTTDRQSRSS